MLRKSQFAVTPIVGGTLPTADELSVRHPDLWDFLTQAAWEDGTPRETGSMLVFCDGGALKAMLKDRETCRCLWVTASNLSELLQVIEGKLTDPNADWKSDRGMPAARGKNQGRK